MKALCFTVDLDRDVNIQVPGKAQAGSLDRGAGTEPRFSSSEKGLEVLLDVLGETGVQATFFAEGRTLETISSRGLSRHEVGIHGYDHEDLTSLSGHDLRMSMSRAVAAVRRVVNRSPVSFRAPYMKVNDAVLCALPEFGIKYDSSEYAPLGASILPRRLPCGVAELPVPEGLDSSGRKIAAYLWPMHEGKRQPEDYVRMASEVRGGVFVLATHTWHMVESRDRGPMGAAEASKNAKNVQKTIEGIIDLGFEPTTVSEAVRHAEALRG
ncbi:MAG: polysaccharide deacetylase family protein [Candidatus Methanoplasma sp.]|jgi:peptidoglycan/xylan/chitin deacetylase (PgdA/CDA1 family)|nr:polysaccharide deacetylase family protein [Candidatus Methanoplasma sp.]